MAGDIENKKRRRTAERKLLAGNNVEVFFTDERLNGCWRAGLVIEVGSNSRLIEFTHLLTEDEQSKLVERIPASEAIKGICNTPPREQRGSIRPFPSSCVFPGSEIKYGLCVDAWLYGAWWEGVVFDKNMGSEKRKVFFPDTGDQYIVAVDQLRVTQEWNEYSGHWKPRGEWVLLQVLHELKKEGPLPVSIRKIWYDLRSDISFMEKIGSWTAGTLSFWYGVVNDLYRKLLPVVDGRAALEMLYVKSPVERLFESGDNWDAIFSPDLLAADDHTLDEHANNNLIPYVECTLYTDNMEEEVKIHKDNLKPTMRKSWLSMPLEGEQCPEAITLYCKPSAKARKPCPVYEDMKVKMRKHLAYLGWKIESKRDRVLRYRYTSPDGEIFYSLNTVCSYFTKGYKNKNSLSMKKHEHEREKLNVTLKQQASKKGMVVDIPEFSPGTKFEDFNNQQNSNFSGSASSKVVQQGDTIAEPSTSRKGDLILSVSESTDQPVPEDLHGAVHDYCQYMSVIQKDKQVILNANAKLLRLKAKRYLSFMGWKFWFISKKMKEEMRYDSPYGKTYCSLHTACKAYLEQLAESSGPSSRDLNKRRKTSKGVHTSRDFENLVKVNVHESRFGSSTDATSSNNSEYMEPQQGELCSRGLRKRDGRKKEPSKLLLPLRPSHVKLRRYTAGRSSDFQSRETKPSRSSVPASWSSKRPQHAPSCSGKRNVKTVLCSLIDKNVVLPREKVSYIRKRDGKVLMQGRISRDGIKCDCCQQVFTLTNFEAHAGSTSHRPAANIFLQDRRSLLQCQKELIHVSNFQDFSHPQLKSDYSQSPSDSICSICQDGGILLLCDHCPSAFHQHCIGLEVIPEGKWFCPCCKCSICGTSDFNSDTKQFNGKTIIYCDQCQREFHVGCLRESGVPGLTDCPTADWFCSKRCFMVFFHLQKLLGKPNLTPVEGLSWSLYRSSRENGVNDIESVAEYHSKLRVALDVLHECFVDIIEPRTKSDLVADLLFNRKSDLKRLNFWGFYTMVLERGDELISVATFRIFGDKVAEMPLIGTLVQYRRRGMCRLLVNELEKLLLSLGVEMLILPAVPQLLQTWTTRFGFTRMTSFDRLKLLDYIFLNFQDTCLCYKLLAGNKNQLTAAVNASTEETNNNNNASETIEVLPMKCLPVMEADNVHSASATNTESAGQIVPYDANDGVALDSKEEITSAKVKLKPTTNNINARFDTLEFYYRRRVFAGKKLKYETDGGAVQGII